MKHNLLLVIDAQNDFCSPSGSLYVPGADKDMARLASFVRSNAGSIDYIMLSQDLHQVIDVSHPAFWRSKEGDHPSPFTQITSDDVIQGTWIPIFDDENKILRYLEQLKRQGEFPHIIWPEHCIEGSVGAAIVPELMNEIIQWARRGRFFSVMPKGQNPFTEHFGIIRANIPDPDDRATQENTELLDFFRHRCSTIWIAGEAKSHCVANTIKQMLPYPEIIEKLQILEDCMSPVAGFEHIADSIYQKAVDMGAQMVRSEIIIE